ncbi:leucyl aminopeptidase [Alteriqipengyuania lutimaris]|uniref:Probable cytosol aminopeptidase n=1 Tax=Alteriqipengyuania lutimaris TaxID=1538146 RepID=A0A395LNS8_9SPHN|nr:leucyl aminopeptidase [Alteriqipengyuania lutimaris]MBB3033867.1 leucyl aminopeptidase [Alteriqipengyuania lutimaris]RDS77164.1 leucyl aminopeptidase [Alteriqipengyuania lutimaris]
MHITFADTLPTDAALIASIANKDSLPDGIAPVLAEGARRARFKGSPGQVVDGFVEHEGKVVRVALAGAGDPGAKDRRANLEKAGGALAAKFLTSGEESLALDLTNSSLSADDAAAVLLGLRLRAWRWDEYRTTQKDAEKVSLKGVVVVGAPEGIDAAWAREGALAEGVEFTKELVTLPANVLYPESFVERCRKALEGTGIEITVLDDAEMEKLGMGALLGVGQGSERPSRILAMKWNGGEANAKPTLLVGKGVTFDSGGISIKPGAGMEDMKWDMGGAGAVAGTMVALAKRKAKANVIGVCGLVENMPDGKAQRPGDVVTTMSGQTVEVINTDAEGRLVLCDALHWAQEEYKPAAVVDLATLTGAMLIALGHEQAGLFSNDDTLAGNLSTAGQTSGDKVWRMPIGPAYDKLIDSPIADMKNVGPREAGSITAAQFLKRFIKDGTPWAHLDIAGMAWSNKPGATWGKGATGYGVRLLDQYVRDVLEG